MVFGGAAGRAFSTKTYEFDGSRWYELDAPGPAGRVGHGMAWSEVDGGVLLYGGFSEQQFRDLWRWDGTRWTQLSAEGPTYTEGHVVAEAGDGIHVVGPGLGSETAARVWHWDGRAFKAVGEAGPILRVGATATYDRRRSTLIYWGGSDGTGSPSDVLHEFAGTVWRTVERPR